MISDEDLVVRLAGGEPQALDALLERYEQAVARFIFRRTAGRDVEDLYQETWLRVVRFSDRFRADQRFSTWLFQIAVNVCRDWWRARGRLPEGDPVSPHGRGAESASDAAIDVERLLARLPDEQREVIALRYLQDMSERDAAEVLGCPPGTVKSRLHNGLAALARMVAPRKDGSHE